MGASADGPFGTRSTADSERDSQAVGAVVVHSRDELRAFLRGETRQVWARVRVSGDPVYLEVGSADRVRELAKREWGCIVPTCRAPITTRGGSRRDHFVHVNGTGHGEGGAAETQNHLAAKAMLREWASRMAPDAVVEEEQFEAVAAQRGRRPDVSVAWLNPRHMVALEVEYKKFTYEAWSEKEADFDSARIVRTWLIGHTRFNADLGDDPARWDGAVTLPQQARILADAGLHVLVVNPVTRQIGTVAGDRDFTMRIGPKQRRGWLVLDDVDECRLTAAGLVTPSMQRLEGAARAREQAAREAPDGRTAAARATRGKERTDRRPRSLLARPGGDRERRPAGHRRRTDPARTGHECWEAEKSEWMTSEHRKRLIDRWGQIPVVIEDFGERPRGINAYPVRWHAVLYESLLHRARTGGGFRTSECWSSLHDADITWNTKGGAAAISLENYLASLAAAGLIARTEGDRWVVRGRYQTGDEGGPRPEERQHPEGERVEAATRARPERERFGNERARSAGADPAPGAAARSTREPIRQAPRESPVETASRMPTAPVPQREHGRIWRFFAKLMRR